MGIAQEEFKGVLNNNELPAARPLAGRPMQHIVLIECTAPRFVPRYRRPPQHKEEVERQVDELLKKGKVQEWTSAFGQDPRCRRISVYVSRQ